MTKTETWTLSHEDRLVLAWEQLRLTLERKNSGFHAVGPLSDDEVREVAADWTDFGNFGCFKRLSHILFDTLNRKPR